MIDIGTSYEGGDRTFIERVLPVVDVVEIIPDTLAVKDTKRPYIPDVTLRELAEIASKAKIIVHGIGLSIGSYDRWNEDYFRLVDQIVEAVPVTWHSEHLGFINVEGQFLGTMLALPRTQEVLDLVSHRVQQITERYQLPFLLENVVNLLPDPPAETSEAHFLNELARNSGCGLLLDVYNLECNAHNQNYLVADFLNVLDFDFVREIHIAGGTERAGLKLDVHSQRSHNTTQKILSTILTRATKAEAIIFELMSQAVPSLGYKAWAEELVMLHNIVSSSWTSRHISAVFSG